MSIERRVGRRTFLRRGLAAATVAGVGLGVGPGTVAAMNKAELVEAMASESGLSKADSKRALDAMVGTARTALKKGDRVALIGFGTLAPPSGRLPGPARYSNIVLRRRAPVDEFQFAPDEALVAALDLVPGGHHRGATRRACPGERDGHHAAGDAEGTDDRCVVVVDAARLARESGLSKADAKRALDGFVAATTGALKKGDRVSLVGFGSFSISKRAARKGRNPQTGKEIQIAAKNVVRFTPDPERTSERGGR